MASAFFFCGKQVVIDPVTLRAKTASCCCSSVVCREQCQLLAGRENPLSRSEKEEEETIKAQTRWMQLKRAPAGLKQEPDDTGRSNTASQQGRSGEIYLRMLDLTTDLCSTCRFTHTHTHTSTNCCSYHALVRIENEVETA